jgi:hypothetical protein
MKRSLQDWASIAEIIGAIAIVISLAYVAFEISENTKALQATTRQSLSDNDLTYFATALDSSVVAIAQDKLLRGEELSTLETSQLKERQHLNFRIFENGYSQFLLGSIEPKEWERYAQVIRINLCQYLPARLMWQDVRHGFDPEFRSAVDDIGSHCSCDEVSSSPGLKLAWNQYATALDEKFVSTIEECLN